MTGGGMRGCEGCSWRVGLVSHRFCLSKGKTKFDCRDFSLLEIIDMEVDRGLSSFNYNFLSRSMWIFHQTDNSILEILSGPGCSKHN